MSPTTPSHDVTHDTLSRCYPRHPLTMLPTTPSHDVTHDILAAMTWGPTTPSHDVPHDRLFLHSTTPSHDVSHDRVVFTLHDTLTGHPPTTPIFVFPTTPFQVLCAPRQGHPVPTTPPDALHDVLHDTSSPCRGYIPPPCRGLHRPCPGSVYWAQGVVGYIKTWEGVVGSIVGYIVGNIM